MEEKAFVTYFIKRFYFFGTSVIIFISLVSHHSHHKTTERKVDESSNDAKPSDEYHVTGKTCSESHS